MARCRGSAKLRYKVYSLIAMFVNLFEHAGLNSLEQPPETDELLKQVPKLIWWRLTVEYWYSSRILDGKSDSFSINLNPPAQLNLFCDKGRFLDSVYNSTDVTVGDEIESDRYLVTIEVSL